MVSAVSPDCETNITAQFLSIVFDVPYLNSEPISAFDGTPKCSSTPRPRRPAYDAVPQATKYILGNFASFFAIFSISVRSAIAFFTACGSSWISFIMKCSKPPFSACAILQFIVLGFLFTTLPEFIFFITTFCFPTIPYSPSSRTMTFFVSGRSAGMSDATKFSPFPIPTISGLSCLAMNILFSLSDSIATAKLPPSFFIAETNAASVPPPPLYSSSMRWGMTSVSVSERNLWPLFTRRALRSSKFSIIPLWTTANFPLQSLCGWAFFLDGAPWVAHLVCAIATFESAYAASFSTSATLPLSFVMWIAFLLMHATPAES